MPFVKDDKPQAATERAGERQAQRIAELERSVGELRGALLDLATGALQLLDLSPPRKAADAVIVGDIVKRARKALAHLKSLRH